MELLPVIRFIDFCDYWIVEVFGVPAPYTNRDCSLEDLINEIPNPEMVHSVRFMLDWSIWKFEVPECIIRFKNLKGLYIDTSLYTIEFYPSIKQLQHLQIISIDGGIKWLPHEITTLPSLHTLIIPYGRFVKIPPEVFECKNLEVLDVSRNLNLMEIPLQIKQLTKLKHLFCNCTNLETLPSALFKLPQIETIMSKGNIFKTLPKEAITALHTKLHID
jgi:hypothetical protein